MSLWALGVPTLHKSTCYRGMNAKKGVDAFNVVISMWGSTKIQLIELANFKMTYWDFMSNVHISRLEMYVQVRNHNMSLSTLGVPTLHRSTYNLVAWCK